VIREIDIWRVAVLMVNRYADAAEARADRCAVDLETEGDHTGAAIRSPPQRQQHRGKQQESAECQPHPSLGQAAGERDASGDRRGATNRKR